MSNKAWLLIGFALSGIAFIAIANGCDLQDFVKVPISDEVKHAVGLPQDDSVSLADGQRIYDEWIGFVESQTLELQRDLGAAKNRYETLQSSVSIGWSAAESHLSVVPGGSIIIALLTGVMGLLIPQPGTKKKIRELKVKSFREGMSVERAVQKTEK